MNMKSKFDFIYKNNINIIIKQIFIIFSHIKKLKSQIIIVIILFLIN